MKRSLMILTVVCLCFCLCACGKEVPQTNGSSAADAVVTTSATLFEEAVSTETTTSVSTTEAENTGATKDTTALSAAPTTTTASQTMGTTTDTSITASQTMATTTIMSQKATTTTTTTVTKTTTTAPKTSVVATTSTMTSATAPITTTTTTTTTVATKPTVRLQQGSMTGQTLQVGDRMYDITITDTTGESVTLSALLQQKELVVLNFWFANCSFCIKEFPAMSAAYEAYKDRVAVYALNPIDGAAKTRQFRADNTALLFPMAACPYEWAQAFLIKGYPTTVVIDRDGIIRRIHTGALIQKSDWVKVFEQYI